MIKAFLVSHNDSDGLGSSMIAEAVLVSNDIQVVSVSNVGNHEVDQTILQTIDNAYDSVRYTDDKAIVIVTDVTPNENTAKLIDKYLNDISDKLDLVVLDHHKHALFLNEYSWANVVVEKDGVLQSGTSLLVDFLYEHGLKISYNVFEYAEQIRRYDTWDWSRNGWDFPKRLNDLLFLLGHKSYKEEVMPYLLEQSDSIIPEKCDYLLDVEADRIDNYIKRKFKTVVEADHRFFIEDGDMFRVGLVSAEQYQSELGNKMCEEFDIDIAVMVDFSNKKVSLRSVKEDVDVSAIAKAKGGGGHKSAAGYPLSTVEAILFASYFTMPVKED